MGLLTKLKSVSGIIKNKSSSAIGAIKQRAVISKALGKVGRVIGPVARVGAKVGRFAFKRTAVGTALTVGAVGVSAVKYISTKRKQSRAKLQNQGIINSSESKSGLGKRLLKGAAIIAAGGGLAYGTEKLAERFGVRGGAGFIGNG